MKHNFLLVFLSLLTSYSCNDTVTYINYGEDIKIESTYAEKIENNLISKGILVFEKI